MLKKFKYMVIGSNTHVHLELLAAKAIILAKSLSLVRSSPEMSTIKPIKLS